MERGIQAKRESASAETGSEFGIVDVFSGCGGMTCGFLQAGGFESRWAIDYEPDMIATYRSNFDQKGEHTTVGDVREWFASSSTDMPKAEVVVGGPPCQGFSLLNKNRRQDSRRALWWYMAATAKASGASVVVIENVRQLITSPEFPQIIEALREIGFNSFSAAVLCTADFGVPQVRHRTILMASRVGPISLPRPSHCDPARLHEIDCAAELSPWQDVRSAIGDLGAPVGTQVRNEAPPFDLHFGRNPTQKSKDRYRAVPPGGNRFDLQRNRPDLTPDCWVRKKSGGTDLFGRLWWDRPSVTIRTEFFKPEKGRYLHPVEHRPITHREGARIQGFPDDFIFRGSKIQIAKQIGNAVPPPLGRAIGEEVRRCLRGECSRQYVADTTTHYEVATGRAPTLVIA